MSLDHNRAFLAFALNAQNDMERERDGALPWTDKLPLGKLVRDVRNFLDTYGSSEMDGIMIALDQERRATPSSVSNDPASEI